MMDIYYRVGKCVWEKDEDGCMKAWCNAKKLRSSRK